MLIEEGERAMRLIRASSVKDAVLPRMDKVMDSIRHLHAGGKS